jgi:Holliday junction resolvasome RuvABC endonuclease subunit
MGLDASRVKTGYCILDTDAPFSSFVERGRLYTTPSDGIMIQRLLKQQQQIADKLEEFSVDFVSMEAPYFGGKDSEHLYALNQFIHKVFLDRGTFVICFPPQQMKKLSLPDKKIRHDEIFKAHMIFKAQEYYNLEGKVLTDDEADALHAGRLGKFFYQWHFEKKLKESDLPPELKSAFCGKKVWQRGEKAGATEYKGMIFRENELFFDFNLIAKRQLKRQLNGAQNGGSKRNTKKQDSSESGSSFSHPEAGR